MYIDEILKAAAIAMRFEDNVLDPCFVLGSLLDAQKVEIGDLDDLIESKVSFQASCRHTVRMLSLPEGGVYVEFTRKPQAFDAAIPAATRFDRGAILFITPFPEVSVGIFFLHHPHVQVWRLSPALYVFGFRRPPLTVYEFTSKFKTTRMIQQPPGKVDPGALCMFSDHYGDPEVLAYQRYLTVFTRLFSVCLLVTNCLNIKTRPTPPALCETTPYDPRFTSVCRPGGSFMASPLIGGANKTIEEERVNLIDGVVGLCPKVLGESEKTKRHIWWQPSFGRPEGIAYVTDPGGMVVWD